MAEAQTTVLLVDFENYNLKLVTDGGELRGMLDLLGPGQVTDVNQTVHALLKLYKDTEVGEVADGGDMTGIYRIFLCDGSPRVLLKLLDAERHLPLLAVEGQDNGLYLVAYLQEVLGTAQVERP